MMKLRRLSWITLVVCMDRNEKLHKNLVRKPEGKGPLGRLGCGWWGNTKIGL
jgi:hypothetical protein